MSYTKNDEKLFSNHVNINHNDFWFSLNNLRLRQTNYCVYKTVVKSLFCYLRNVSGGTH